MSTVREALLLPEYAPWYPEISANTWLPAGQVAQAVRQQLEHREPRWEAGTRILSDVHFQFRSGPPEPSRLVRSRHGDPGVQATRSLW